MVQVTRLGTGFAVLVDGVVATAQLATRGEAISQALKIKEMSS